MRSSSLMPSNVALPSWYSHETRWPLSGSSVLLRIQRERERAAHLMTCLYPRGRKVRPISSQKLSVARETGGAVGDVAALMVADPASALQVAEYLASVARSLSSRAMPPLGCVLLIETRADAEEDVAQDALRNEETPESLRNYIDAARRAKAALESAIDAAEKRLREVEGQ